jgi:CubicO group peptidase (beta-lactamase class C family)
MTSNNRSFIFILTLFILSSCGKPELEVPPTLSNNQLASDFDKAVNDIFIKYQEGLNTPGVSIGIYKDKTSYFYGYGEAKKGTGRIPDKNTYYEIGSITKTFTTLAAMQMLKEKGQSIDTKIRSYLPNDLPTLQREGVEVTFKNLMNHTSGLNYFPDNFGLGIYTGKIASTFANYSREDLYTYLKNARLQHKPSTDFIYSNTGMGLLGTILELNYNKTYNEVLKEKVLNPLGLLATKVLFEETNLDNWATGYSPTGEEVKYWKTLNALDGAGVIKSNASDILKYGIANLNPPASSLGKAIVDIHQISYEPFDKRTNNKVNGRLGWFQLVEDKLPEQSFIWHNGGTEGFNSELYINKEKGTVLVIFFNKDSNTQEREDFKSDLLALINK